MNPADQELVDRAVDYLRAHLDETISVAQLAAGVWVSPRTLQRALKRMLNESPKKLIRAVKLDEARRLLVSGRYRVSEVAYLVGFSSAEHFARRFKALHGVTPSSLIPDQLASAA